MGKSKIIFGGQVQIDLTQDTLAPEKVLRGYTGHGADGEIFEGTCDYTVDASEVGTLPGEVLDGKPFGKGGKIEHGTMPNRGSAKGTIASKNGKYNIQQGYHDGSGEVELDDTEKAKLIPQNIRQGVTILDVKGEMTGTEDAKPQSKSVTPSVQPQTVLPDEGYNYLSQVNVAGIPYEETENAAGGITVTIG